jgi:hypothetical protein
MWNLKQTPNYKKLLQRTKVVQNTDINEIANLFASTRRLQPSSTVSEQVKQPYKKAGKINYST